MAVPSVSDLLERAVCWQCSRRQPRRMFPLEDKVSRDGSLVEGQISRVQHLDLEELELQRDERLFAAQKWAAFRNARKRRM
ncbi:MAG: hypothetical protein D6724_09395 [Armatimonadetes bacterium]|nr:MAG: hypothetical protein D6724_09395 [Armatimonadota bacterium]